MVKWPIPTMVKQLRGFLGLTGYYRHFFANYASIAAPLIDLLCHDSFCWSPAASTTFEALKQAMVAALVLHLLDISKWFVIETDAFNMGTEAVQMQDGHPLAFFQ